MEERDYFPFYYSFFEALKHLPYKERCALCYAIVQFGITDQEDEHKLTGGAAAAFEVIKPILHKSFTRAKSGKKGGESGSKTEANPEANTEAKPEANVKQTSSKHASNNDNDNDNNISSLREIVDSKNILSTRDRNVSSYHGKKTDGKRSQFLGHGEISPLMRDAARQMQEAEG